MSKLPLPFMGKYTAGHQIIQETPKRTFTKSPEATTLHVTCGGESSCMDWKSWPWCREVYWNSGGGVGSLSLCHASTLPRPDTICAIKQILFPRITSSHLMSPYSLTVPPSSYLILPLLHPTPTFPLLQIKPLYPKSTNFYATPHLFQY